jgi:uncharacterized protein (TIGR00255 family)
MTGFGRAEGETDDLRWVWEIRSVNGKGLDVRLRLPNGLDKVDAEVRKRSKQSLTRGNVTMNLQVDRTRSDQRLQINQALLDQVLGLAASLEGRGVERPRLDALLAIRGVVETVDDQSDGISEAAELALMDGFDTALTALVDARAEEGARVAALLSGQLADIADKVNQARESAAPQPAALRERLELQVAEILSASPPMPEERLVQEVALLAVKADVREELDRLDAHIEQARDLLAVDEPVGRRLDFLCQEFNREANTLCSKSTDVGLTRIGLALKASVDQLREQVQNIE